MIVEAICNDGDELEAVLKLINAYFNSRNLRVEEMAVEFETDSILCISELEDIVGFEHVKVQNDLRPAKRKGVDHEGV